MISAPADKAPSPGRLDGRKVLIIVENLSVPFDRRVWQEARTLHAAGAQVCVICPLKGKEELRYELLEGITIYRHPLPEDGNGMLSYLSEYASALFWETFLAWKVFFKHGFDTIHGCNPPDLIFLIAWQFRLLGKRYVFDHHDINPELFESKFNKRGGFWRALRLVEWLTFKTATTVISTNESYKQIAIERGGKKPDDVFVVRSGPDLSRIKLVEPVPSLKMGKAYLVGYVGVMGEQEGIDLLLESVRHLVLDIGRTDTHFCIVGGGPSLASLRALSSEMQLDGYVTFTGRAPDQLLFEVLSTSDVCVNPDRVNPMNDKSTMNKILEYMAMGKPIVQFDVTEGRVSAQEASVYAKANDPVDFARKISDLLDDPAARDRMGRIGRDRVVKQLSWDYEAPKLVSAYKHSAR